DCVYINDPAEGPRTVSYEEFGRSFSGIVLIFERGPQFQTGGSKPSLLSGLGPRIRTVRAGIAFLALCGVALIVPGIVLPTFTRVFIDDVLIRDSSEIVKPLLIGMAITAIVRMILTWLER